MKLNPQSSHKSSTIHYNHMILSPTLIYSSFILSYSMAAFHLFLSGAHSTPAYLHSGCPLANEYSASLFPAVHFVRFNHVTLSQADYRRLSSLEKVRAGIRASWGIRSPNWFQLSLPSNDQVFNRIDRAVDLYVRRGS